MRRTRSSPCRAAPGTTRRSWRASSLRRCCSCPASTASATTGQKIQAKPTSYSAARLSPMRRRRLCVKALNGNGLNSQPPRPEAPRSSLEGRFRSRKTSLQTGTAFETRSFASLLWMRPWGSAPFRSSRGPGLSVLFGRHQHRHCRVDAAASDRHAGKLQSHLHSGYGAEQREVVDVAEMADPKNRVLENPETIAEAHIELPQNQRPQRIGAVALRKPNCGQGRRIVRRLKTLQFDRARLAPSIHGSSRRRTVT